MSKVDPLCGGKMAPESIVTKDPSPVVKDAIAKSVVAASQDHVMMTVEVPAHVIMKGWMESMNKNN